MNIKNIYSAIVGKFIGKQDGAILVEFALVLPMFLMFIAISMEFGRVFWTYQSAIAGVRDASRYLSRVAPIEICLNGGNLAGYATEMQDIVENVLGGASIFPSSITITSVTPSLTCVSGAYRIPEVPIATVSANMTITWPLGNIFSLFGNGLGTITTTITDQARIYGQ